MFRHTVFGLLAILAVTAGFLANSAAFAAEGDEAAIREIYDTYTSARVAGDAETWLSLWDAEGIQMPPGMPARGKDVLDAGIPKAFSAIPAKAVNINPEEIVVAGDWAYSRGSYNADQVVQGKDVHIDGKFLTIFRRQDDGSWRIYRDIFNFNDR
jgi:uncharacterized protein (TIGR02246 family)